MLYAGKLANGIIVIRPAGKLREGDFDQFLPQIDQWLKTIAPRLLLVDATDFEGWADQGAALRHLSFVRSHHRRIDRIALVASHSWQRWLATLASMFVHPEVEFFSPQERVPAEAWLREPMKRAA